MTGQKQNPRVHQILKQQVIPFYFYPSRFPPKITTGVAMPKKISNWGSSQLLISNPRDDKVLENLHIVQTNKFVLSLWGFALRKFGAELFSEKQYKGEWYGS